MQRRYSKPRAALRMSELGRGFFEHQTFPLAVPFLRTLPRGDGHRVLVVPGFTADDRSTRALRWFLSDRGYEALGWGLGANLGPTDRILDGKDALMHRLATSGSPFSIIGWSLGGVMARDLARDHPDAVRSVITLGSPFRLSGRDPEESTAGPLYEALSVLHSERAKQPRQAEEDRPGVPVPVTNIYTRSDGVVSWRSCIDTCGDQTENIGVPGSHSGLGVNPLAFAVIADRLAQPQGAWLPYQPSICLRSHVQVGPRPAPMAAAA